MNIIVRNYFSHEALKTLCIRLAIPSEITERLMFYIGDMDPSLFEPYFILLFSLDTGGDAVAEISLLCGTAEDPKGDSGLRALAVYLAAALHTHEIYGEMGINDDVYFDTIEALRRFLYEHRASFGHFGFDRGFWIYRQLAARLFRLGELEFEIYTLPKDGEPIGAAQPGDPVLSVHIPSDAVMTREALDNSYHMAQEFFARFFPDYGYKCVYCSSWLLSPVLGELLKPGSHILDFQSDYEITQADMEVNDGINWIFKRNYEDFTQLPEDTSLMRGMKKILVSGGKTGAASGYVKNFGAFR